MKVSVVIPAYNAARTLGAVLDALAAQDAPADEVIVVDDNSSDETAAIAGERGARVVRPEGTRFAGGARNRGWDEAAGDVVVFLDSDAIPAPGWGEGLRRALAEFPGAIVGCARTFDARTSWGWVAHLQIETPYLPLGEPRRVRFLSSYCLAVPREAPLRWDESYGGEDGLFSADAIEAGIELVFDPRFHAYHDHARESFSSLRSQQQRLAFGLARIGSVQREGLHKRVLARVPIHYFALLRLPVIYRRLGSLPELRVAVPPAAPPARRRGVDARCQRASVCGAATRRPRRRRGGVPLMPVTSITIGELVVRRLGLGTMALTGRGVWGEARDPGEARRLLRRAVELGVDFVDTADSYGPDVAERLVAEALHPYNGIVVATKAGLTRQGPGRWSRNCRPEYLRIACHGSLQRLGVDRIDLYQLHTVDPDVPIEESVGALAELRSEGKIRHIGLCNVTQDQLSRARSVEPIVSVQNRFSLADRSSQGMLERCERDGLAFVAWAPLAKGTLAGSEKLRDLAAAHGATPGQVALAWVLARSPAAVPIPGTSSVERLEENIGAAGVQLTAHDLAQLDRFTFVMPGRGGRVEAARQRAAEADGRMKRFVLVVGLVVVVVMLSGMTLAASAKFDRPSRSVTVERVIDAPRDHVWATVTDFAVLRGVEPVRDQRERRCAAREASWISIWRPPDPLRRTSR